MIYSKFIFSGKKLNHGGHGKDSEVDLLGLEGPPSLSDRYNRLNSEVNNLDEIIESLEDTLIHERNYLFNYFRQIKLKYVKRVKDI